MGSQSIATPQAASKTERYRERERALWDQYGLAPTERFIELASPKVKLRVVEVDPETGDARLVRYVAVDDVGTVAALEREGDGARLEIGAAESIVRYCVEKGSITVDGVSLTVAGVDGATFSIALVPHTLAATTLGRLQPGAPVNLEVDVLAKYVERMLDRR